MDPNSSHPHGPHGLAQEHYSQVQASQSSVFKLRVATYNILNVSDRYAERERLLKKNIYELNADVIGMQEVAFGSKQLDELAHPRGGHLRHSVEHHGRTHGYKVYEAPFQMPEFYNDTLTDPSSHCDGNVFLVDPRISERQKIVKHEILHISAFLNCQRLEIELQDGSKVHIVNLHLHDIVSEEQVRLHQAQNIVYWINKRTKPEDIVIMLGDFNALPENETVTWILKEAGFRSAYREYHGEEPEKTFNTGLISPYMDPDPPCTVDYIFYRDGKTSSGVSLPQRLKLTFSKIMGDKHDPSDHTLYGSDHYPLIADFEISLL